LGKGPLRTATGTTKWSFAVSLTKGKNKISIFAIDALGNKSRSKVIKVERN
jgi:hypothetical protein